MAEDFRKGDRADWNATRVTTEPEIDKRPAGDNGGRAGTDDGRENPVERR